MAHRNSRLAAWCAFVGVAVVGIACGSAVTPATTGSATASTGTASGAQPSDSGAGSGAPEAVFTPIPDASQAPDTGSGAAHGDIPDNAVFLTYRSAAWRFAIQYVEGWQVRTVTDGVTIRDKDSSETVSVVTLPPDLTAYVSGTDLPALRSQPGFSLIKQNSVKVGSAVYPHLVYHGLADPDPVTGKQVPSTVDRFYVPGPGLAIISLSTPDGVDNVDAFRQMITSFKWS
jgi:hypothetical protein